MSWKLGKVNFNYSKARKDTWRKGKKKKKTHKNKNNTKGKRKTYWWRRLENTKLVNWSKQALSVRRQALVISRPKTESLNMITGKPQTNLSWGMSCKTTSCNPQECQGIKGRLRKWSRLRETENTAADNSELDIIVTTGDIWMWS